MPGMTVEGEKTKKSNFPVKCNFKHMGKTLFRLVDLSKLVQKMEKLTKEAAGAAPDLRSIDP